MDKILCRLSMSLIKRPINSRIPRSETFNVIRRSKSSGTSNFIKVAVVGAAGTIGQSLSLMIKQSPYVDELSLYDNQPLESFTADLNFVDTKCRVRSFNGKKFIKKALEASIAIATEPINSTVPMVSEILKKYGHYNPSSVFGVTTLDVVRANKFVAEVQGIEPECVTVPVIGGHNGSTIIPVLSQASPCSEFTNDELEDITKSVREAQDNIIKIKSCDGPNLSTAFATARFVISLVKALRGQQDIVECAFVKSTAHPQLKYMATPILLGPAGVMKNLGVPELSDYEQCLLENAIPLLSEDIKRGEVFGGHKDKPICDVCDPDPKAPRCPPDHCALQSIMLGESKV